jgi:hypothetical protein
MWNMAREKQKRELAFLRCEAIRQPDTATRTRETFLYVNKRSDYNTAGFFAFEKMEDRTNSAFILIR